MDFYSEELELDTINLEDEHKYLGESERNFENGTVSQGSVSATELNTECLTGSQKSVPLTEVITESGIFSQGCVLASETCTKREINNSQSGANNQENAQTTEVSSKVEVTDEKGNNKICSRKEDDPGQLKKEVKQTKRKDKYSKGDEPIRESKRKRKCPQVVNYVRQGRLRSIWTNNDRVYLLRGLEKFGPDDITSIKRYYLPGKSELSIHNQIRTYKEFGRHDFEKKLITAQVKRKNYATINCILKLDEWMEQFEHLADLSPQRLFALSNVFLLISEYGNFPSPNLCEGIDLRAMYRYLHCVLNGKPHFGINKKTADILRQIINHSLKNTGCHEKRMHFLKEIAKEVDNMPVQKTYSRVSDKRVVPECVLETREAILRLPDLNPLNIPPDLLRKEEAVSDSENSCSDDIENYEVCKQDPS